MKKLLFVLLTLLTAAAVAAEVPAIDVVIGGGAVKGTLLTPPSPKAIPVVLIISGSGPTDRNGNSAMIPGQNDSLKMLAEALAENGIASVRYDKRGIGESVKVAEADLRFDTYVDDAIAWCQMLRNDRSYSRVFIVGHSEGSLIGMLAAKRCAAAGFVSIAGAGRPAAEVLRAQLAGKLPPNLAEQSETVLKSLESGKTVENPPQELFVLYRPSVQPYMISWLKLDPAKAIAQLKVPTLILQGTTDIQVSVDDAKKLAAAYPRAKLLVVEGMNHVLKSVPDDQTKQMESYSDPTLPLAKELVPAIVELVKAK